MLRQRPTQPSKVVLFLNNYLLLTTSECSGHSSDARKAPAASHVSSDRLDHASQSPSKEFVWAHGRVRYTLARGSSSAFLTGKKNRKCLKWVIGKKNALGDKPATRRGGVTAAPLSWARLPFATQPLLSTADMGAQRDTVCHISLVPMGICSLSTTPVLGNLARGRGHCRARRRLFMTRTVRLHDGLFKFELSNCQILKQRCMVYRSFAILYICAYHYPSNLSSSLIYYSLVGPPIFRQC
jgi:hypothetical protein